MGGEFGRRWRAVGWYKGLENAIRIVVARSSSVRTIPAKTIESPLPRDPFERLIGWPQNQTGRRSSTMQSKDTEGKRDKTTSRETDQGRRTWGSGTRSSFGQCVSEDSSKVRLRFGEQGGDNQISSPFVVRLINFRPFGKLDRKDLFEIKASILYRGSVVIVSTVLVVEIASRLKKRSSNVWVYWNFLFSLIIYTIAY